MSIPVHTVELIAGGANTVRTDRILAGFYPAVPYAAAASAGQPVSIPLTVKSIGLVFHVDVTPDQDCTWFVTKTGPGAFTITLNPRLPANSLLAGAVDVRVWA